MSIVAAFLFAVVELELFVGGIIGTVVGAASAGRGGYMCEKREKIGEKIGEKYVQI